MIKAQQVERDGTKHGAVRKFTDGQWEYLKSIYGSKLRWEIIGETPEPTKKDIVEFPEIHGEDDELTFSQNDFDTYIFDDHTKKEIVRDFDMADEDKRLSRDKLIEKIHNKVLKIKE